MAAELDRDGCSDGSRINPVAQHELGLDDEGVGVSHGAHVTPHTRISRKTERPLGSGAGERTSARGARAGLA